MCTALTSLEGDRYEAMRQTCPKPTCKSVCDPWLPFPIVVADTSQSFRPVPQSVSLWKTEVIPGPHGPPGSWQKLVWAQVPDSAPGL